MKEIIYPESEYNKSNTEEKCKVCGGEMRNEEIECPEGRAGCAVIHYGYRCLICGRIFQ